MSLFHPTSTSRVVIFRVLRYIQSVTVSSTFASLAVSVSFRISSMVCVGSLTSWPLTFVPFCDLASPWLLVFGFSSDWFPLWDSVQPRSFTPDCLAPCPLLGFTLASSWHSLLIFWLPLRYLASCAPLKSLVQRLCLSHLRSFYSLGVSLHFRSCFPSVLPEWLSLFEVSSFYSFFKFKLDFDQSLFGSPKGLWTVTSSAVAFIKTDARFYVLLRFKV